MHFEFLTEDQSCGKAVDILARKLLGADMSRTYKVHPYKGAAHIPKNLTPQTDPAKRILLDQLPRLLRGYGKAQPDSYVIVICDLDRRVKRDFLSDLQSVLAACNPSPRAYFCLAVEELEAWYLGDLNAIRSAYPKAKNDVLAHYNNDSICGTWELLADAIYRGGHTELKKKGWQAVGEEKSNWARAITPHMAVDRNRSPSFNFLRSTLQTIIGCGMDEE
jgi:hypothetical protein